MSTACYRLDTSGSLGANGINGKSGPKGNEGKPGGPGAHGTVGKAGAHAGNINLHILKVVTETGQSAIQITDGRGSHLLDLGNPNTRIQLKARGGGGGKGGNGGPGGAGGTGYKGEDANIDSCGTDGGPGGPGGKGGTGAVGGRGGNGGIVQIQVSEQNMHLLMLLENTLPDLSGGLGGSGGKGGTGGLKGSGGPGGNSHSWTHTYMTRHWENGHRPGYGYFKTQTHHEHYSNPGGHRGPNGFQGTCGQSGTAGHNGKNGQFSIVVQGSGPGAGTYSEPYDLKVSGVELQDSNQDGIIEPGDHLSLKLSVKNVSSMPTPVFQKITVGIKDTDWVFLDPNIAEPLQLEKSLLPGESYTFDRPLILKVKEAPPSQNQVLRQEAIVDLRATVSEVNKSFKRVEKQFTKFPVKYPVQISAIAAPLAIASGEQAPIAIRVKNVSKKAVGDSSELRRIVEVSLDQCGLVGLEAQNLQFRQANGEVADLAGALMGRISLLKPGASMVLTGTIELCKPEIPIQSRCRITASLGLSPVLGDSKPVQVVQTMDHILQLGTGCDAEDADLLLVTNHRTSQKEMAAWSSMASELGMGKIAIWNLSLLGGLSLEQVRKNGTRLLDQLKGKTIVVLNNGFSCETGEEGRAMKQIAVEEFCKLAREEAIHFYFVGAKGVPFYRFLVPVQDKEVKELKDEDELLSIIESDFATGDQAQKLADGTFFSIPCHYSCWSSKRPPEELLKKEAEKLKDLLEKKYPEQSFIVVHDYVPEQLEDSLRKKWRLGSIQVHRSLPRNEASFSVLSLSEGQIHHPLKTKKRHQFNLLKLLNFDEKLRLLSSDQRTGPALDLLQQAILSDLADEQFVYRQDTWNWRLSKEKLRKGLAKAAAFCAYQPTLELKEFYRDSLVKLKILCQDLVGPLDHLLPFRRQQSVSNETLRYVNAALTDLGYEDNVEAIEQYFKARYEAGDTPSDVLESYRDPLAQKDAGLKQDNWRQRAKRVISLREYQVLCKKKTELKIHEDRFVFSSQKERLAAIQDFARRV